MFRLSRAALTALRRTSLLYPNIRALPRYASNARPEQDRPTEKKDVIFHRSGVNIGPLSIPTGVSRLASILGKRAEHVKEHFENRELHVLSFIAETLNDQEWGLGREIPHTQSTVRSQLLNLLETKVGSCEVTFCPSYDNFAVQQLTYDPRESMIAAPASVTVMDLLRTARILAEHDVLSQHDLSIENHCLLEFLDLSSFEESVEADRQHLCNQLKTLNPMRDRLFPLALNLVQDIMHCLRSKASTPMALDNILQAVLNTACMTPSELASLLPATSKFAIEQYMPALLGEQPVVIEEIEHTDNDSLCYAARP